jgi:hypothetical protein
MINSNRINLLMTVDGDNGEIFGLLQHLLAGVLLVFKKYPDLEASHESCVSAYDTLAGLHLRLRENLFKTGAIRSILELMDSNYLDLLVVRYMVCLLDE